MLAPCVTGECAFGNVGLGVGWGLRAAIWTGGRICLRLV